MQKFVDINVNYSSDLVGELLKAIKPEEQAQINHKMKLAAKIYSGLKAKGWKSNQLAKALNLKSPSLVSKWLSGTHNFTVDTLIDIQHVLGIKLIDEDLPDGAITSNMYFTVSSEQSSLKDYLNKPLENVIGLNIGLHTTITTKN